MKKEEPNSSDHDWSFKTLKFEGDEMVSDISDKLKSKIMLGQFKMDFS